MEPREVEIAAESKLERLPQDRRGDLPGRPVRRRLDVRADRPAYDQPARPATASTASSSTPRPASRSSATIRSRATRSRKDEYVAIEPEEIAAVIPHSDKTLDGLRFIDARRTSTTSISTSPISLRPRTRTRRETFALVRDGMRRGRSRRRSPQAVLFRRARTLLIRAYENGLARRRSTSTTRCARPSGRVLRHPGDEDHRRDARSRHSHHQDQAGRLRSARVPRSLRGRAGRARQG